MHLLIRSQQRQPYPILCCINYAGANHRSFANGIPQIMPYQPLAQKVEQKPQRRWTRNDQKQEILPPQSQKFNLLSDNWQNSHRIWKQKRDEMKRKNAFGHHSSEMALLQQYIAADEGKNSQFPAKAAFSNVKSSSASFYPKQRQDQSSYNQQQNWQQPQRRMEETYEKFNPNYEYLPPQRRAPIGRLFNPQDEIRKIRTTMNHFLMEEYLRSNGSKESLDKILKWAERMRQKNLEKSPILAMIDKLNWRRETRPLIMPLYICFLKTPEAKMYKDRAELILPAIAHAFNAENPILAVNSISKKISKMMECYTPDGIETIRRFMQIQFRIFIHQIREQQSPMQRNSTALCAIKVKEMAAALRQSGCYPTPLTDTFVFPKLFDNASNDEWKMEMFKAFMEEPAERELFTNSKGKLFTARPHIFFPLLMEKFRKQDSDRWFLLGKMFYFLTNPLQQRQTTPMPNFIVEFVKDRLGKLFNISCKCGHFDLAKRILDYNKRSEGKFDIYISPISLLKYWLHLWANKRLLDARIVGEKLYERIYWLKESEKQSGKNQKQLEEWRNLQKRLNSMNKCFRELMDNPQTNDEEREKYAKLFIGVLRDQIS